MTEVLGGSIVRRSLSYAFVTQTTAARFAALLAVVGCGGRSAILAGSDSAGGGTAGSSGSLTTGGNAGSVATGGSAGSFVTGGTSGAAGDGTTLCHGLEVNLLTSPLHCGACENDCRGGGCNAGQCSPAPFTLADSNYEPRPGTSGVSIALDEERVYYAESDTGRIRSVTKDGRDARDLAIGLAGPCELALSDDFVYFATCGDDEVARIPKRGGAAATVLASAPGARLAFANGSLYVAAAGTVQRIFEDDGVATVIARPFAVWPLWDLQADSSVVYWPVRDLDSDDGLYAADVNGGGEGRILVADDLLRIVVRDFTLFATTRGSTALGDVVQYSFDSGMPVPLVRSEPTPEHLAVDDDHVFYSVQHFDSVLRRSSRHGDQTPFALVSGQDSSRDGWANIFDMALDETRVFFAMRSAIKSVPK
ncbi:MAG TPA: hypothetical protein VF103_02075 [Polyangiaceae bacterium]